MVKYWKIRVDDLEESLIYLDVDKSFFELSLNNRFIQNEKYHKYIYIEYDLDRHWTNGWGWDRIVDSSGNVEDYEKIYPERYQYCGYINLRKLKLEKLNE
jgi:hypothetical protein